LTISGTPGSGKTVVSNYLSKKLKMKYYSVGELMREFAKKKNIDLIKLSRLMEEDKSLDRKFNEDIKKLNKKDNFILDSRLGFLFIKKGIHVFLDADINLRAERIFKDRRKLESYDNIKNVKKEIKKRFLSERKRFRKLYKVDFTDVDNYDLVIDTTGMNVTIISNIILRYLKKCSMIH
jgi:predicted cytidylate kinase